MSLCVWCPCYNDMTFHPQAAGVLFSLGLPVGSGGSSTPAVWRKDVGCRAACGGRGREGAAGPEPVNPFQNLLAIL